MRTEESVVLDQTVAFLNGRILTMDQTAPTATGLIALGERILAVGDSAELARGLPPGAEVVDLAGRTVAPGFVDAHCHLELATTHWAFATMCFVPPHRSITEIGETLRRAADDDPGEGWLVGRADFSVHLFVQERRAIERSDLDAAVPDRPVVVFSGLHFATLNTKALEITGLLDAAPLPRGSMIDLATGRGTELWTWLPLPTFGIEPAAAAIRDMGLERFTARGVTSIAEIPYSLDGVRAYQTLRRRGELPARISLQYTVEVASPEQLARVGLETGFGDDWLRIGGTKFFVDGAGQALDGSADSDIKWSQVELDDLVGVAHGAGLQVWMHVQSEQAVRMGLRAIERAQATRPRHDARHRLEHAGDMRLDPSWWDRFEELGVLPVATPQFIHSYGDWYPEDNSPQLKTLRTRGFRVPGNSDSTGSQPEAANPLHGIRCAMLRTTRRGTILDPDEAIDLNDAMRMFTSDAAWACHLDDRGTLEQGKLADLVVFGVDPWGVAPEDLTDVPVDLTVIGGKVVYEQGSS
jgi:predicted amidohydrolase YtcJ